MTTEKTDILNRKFYLWTKKMGIYAATNNAVLRKRIYNQFLLYASLQASQKAENALTGNDFSSLQKGQSLVSDAMNNLSRLVEAASSWAAKPKLTAYTGEDRWKFTRCAVVEVISKTPKAINCGTGFICDILYGKEKSIIQVVTNKHVVEDCFSPSSVSVRFRAGGENESEPTQEFPVSQIFLYQTTSIFDCDDLCILTALIPSDAENFENACEEFEPHSLPLRKKPFANGVHVFTIGNRAGHGLSFSEGCVSQTGATLRLRDSVRKIYNDTGEIVQDGRTYKNLVQFSLAATGGSSGGPIMDNFGQVIAVVSFCVVDSNPMYYAIPMTQVFEMIDQYNKAKEHKIQIG